MLPNLQQEAGTAEFGSIQSVAQIPHSRDDHPCGEASILPDTDAGNSHQNGVRSEGATLHEGGFHARYAEQIPHTLEVHLRLGFPQIRARFDSASFRRVRHGERPDLRLCSGKLEYPYNVTTAQGFEEAAKAKGVKTVVLDPRGSVEKQGNALDDLISQKVDAIGFLPLDSVVAESFVDKINEAKIPVVAIALQVGDSAKRKLERSLSRTVRAGGDRQLSVPAMFRVRWLRRFLPKDQTAKIGIVMGDPAYTIVKLDTEGFRAALDKAGAKYKIVAEQPTNWTPDEGEAVCQNFLTAHPDLDLIFSHADDMAIGCARAIDAANSKVN